MRLGMRLLLSLAAAAIVGGSLLFVVFVFWDQGSEQSRRQQMLERISAEVELGVVRHVEAEAWLTSMQLPAPCSVTLLRQGDALAGRGERFVPRTCRSVHWESTAEYEHLVRPLRDVVGWDCLVISSEHTLTFNTIYKH